ncbi:GSCFA domain-containing protein [Roseomonas sp. CCTCC AB2023176]|uniref:GSCFA domain-containing protein n=1 Tax=Roseomonas sp. CCTCC AB2023176 TaxID=3342640 RepID=UPI0035D9A299
MQHPYADRPDWAFWARAVAAVPPPAVDPVVSMPFRIGPRDPVATAGSCFAQHLARHLRRSGFTPLRAEGHGDPRPEGDALFSARYGNIYTARQLVQLVDEAYGLRRPADPVWRRPDGRYVDALRPRIAPEGFATPEDALAARLPHLDAVRRVLEDCAVFVFTLGLTEAWLSEADGTAYPIAPGVVAEGGPCRFHDFSAAEVEADLAGFVGRLRDVNPAARVLLTVSPVPLVATAGDRHVLPATILSKSKLRVAAEEVSRRLPGVAYFPSYDLVTSLGPRAFDEDRRTVLPRVVNAVMAVFTRHLLAGADPPAAEAAAQPPLDGTTPPEVPAVAPSPKAPGSDAPNPGTPGPATSGPATPETDAPETDAPETDAPETNVPETDTQDDVGDPLLTVCDEELYLARPSR